MLHRLNRKDAEHSLPEMLQLVAEQARELTDAEHCVVTVTAEGRHRAAEAASHADAPLHAAAGRPPGGGISASLTTLDGRELGAIRLFDKRKGSFTDEDHAALVHLAQMASAAVDRTRLYRDRR